MKKDETKPSLKINIILSFIIQIFYFAIPLISTPYLSRVLGPENIGIYSYAFSYVHYFSLFGVFGFLNYGARLISKNRDDLEKRNEIFWAIVFSKLFFVLLSISLYIVLISTHAILGETDSRILYSLLLVLIADAFDITFFFRGIEKLKYASIVTASIKIIYIILIFTTVKTGDDLVLYTLLQSAATFLISLCLWIFAIPRISKPIFSTKTFLTSSKGALMFFLPSIVIGIGATLDQTMLGLFSTNTEIGYYQQASKLTTLLAQVVCSFTPIILSRVAMLRNDPEKNRDEIRTIVTKALSLVLLLMLPAIVGLYCVGKDFFPLFFGDEFIPGTATFFWQLPVSLTTAITSLCITSYYFAIGKTKFATAVIGGGCLFNVALTILLLNVTDLGAQGAAIATMISESISTSILFIFSRKNYIFKDVDYNYLKNNCHCHRVYFCSDSCMRKWRAKNK